MTKATKRYSRAFREKALERMKGCEDITALARELGVHRSVLYQWRDQREAGRDELGPSDFAVEQALREEISELKRLVGEQARELDFFKGALQKVKARRQSSESSGAKASTTRSGS